MIAMSKDSRRLDEVIDQAYSAETSVVCRYRHAFSSGSPEEDAALKSALLDSSIREGARIFPLLTYRGVDLHVLDESSLMHTGTLKSIDGCLTAAKCRLRGYERVVFESGGNTGTALTEYGRKAGLETFCFVPEASVPLLDSRVFESETAHLIAVADASLVKEAARHGGFDWLVQTISAAFGPIGIYGVLHGFEAGLDRIPRFLGIQQEANCPMYKAWTSDTRELVERTGLIALAGAFKAISENRIARGSKVLCCLTSGTRPGDGKAVPDCRVTDVGQVLQDCHGMIHGA